MPNWTPSLDFDEQQLDLQPQCDITFGYYGRNITTLPNNEDIESYIQPESATLLRECEFDLVQKIRSKTFADSLIGRRLTAEEIDHPTAREQEIISMIRQAGMGPSLDAGLDSTRTIAVVGPEKSTRTKRDFPVIFDESYFKLRPRDPKSSASESDTSSSSLVEDKTKTKVKDKIKEEEEKYLRKTKHKEGHVDENKKSYTNEIVTTNDLKSKKLVSPLRKEHKKTSDNIFKPSSPREESIQGRLSPTINATSSTSSNRKSPLPVPRDNANTPILKISETITVPHNTNKHPKRRIGANFSGPEGSLIKCNDDVNAPEIKARFKEALKLAELYTPKDLYMKKQKEKQAAAQTAREAGRKAAENSLQTKGTKGDKEE